MRLLFSPAEDGRCRVTLHRRDGVVLGMLSYDRTFRTPHDLAHAVTERELGLAAGVFGCVAAGAVFSSMRVLSGSPRHDAAAGSARIIKAHARSIALAEVLSGVLHAAVDGSSTMPLYMRAREAWGTVDERPFPYGEDTLARTVQRLGALAENWTALTPGEELAFTWPAALTAPVPTFRRRANRR